MRIVTFGCLKMSTKVIITTTKTTERTIKKRVVIINNSNYLLPVPVAARSKA